MSEDNEYTPRDPDADPEYVGPYHPPRRTRFRKGCPSPNPYGRPPKKRMRTLLQTLDPVTAAILEHGSSTIRTPDGEEKTKLVTNLDAMWKHGILGNAKSQIAYHQFQLDASAKALKIKEEAYRAAIEHQNKWLPTFIDCANKNLPLPDAYPDPRHIVLTDDGIMVLGPTSKGDAMLAKQQLEIREGCAKVAASFDKATAEGRRMRRSLRERYNMLNDLLPPIYQATYAQRVSYYEMLIEIERSDD